MQHTISTYCNNCAEYGKGSYKYECELTGVLLLLIIRVLNMDPWGSVDYTCKSLKSLPNIRPLCVLV